MNVFKEDEGKHLGLFYIRTALDATFAVLGIYFIVYLLDRGFSYSVIGIALALFNIFMIILDVPTGAVADVVGRKLPVMAGFFGYAIVLFIIPFVESPFILIGIFALWALPTAFISGALPAWIVDNLEAEKRTDLIKEFYVKNTSIKSFGSIAAALLSGLIVQYIGMDALWYIYGSVVLACGFILAMPKEHFEKKQVDILKSFRQAFYTVREGASFAAKNKNVLYIICAAFFTAIAGEFVMVCYKPFMEVVGVPREYFGYLSAVGAVFCVGMPFLAKYLAGAFTSEKRYLSIHSLVFGAVLLSVILVSTPVIASLIFVILLLQQNASDPVLEPFFQKFLSTRLRATMNSFRHMVASVAFLTGDFIISAFTDMTGPQVIVVAAGVIMLPSIIFYLGIEDSG
ncbi:MAG: MFS transporter [Theionarchaea archaeon]|nr:MFS transporter [Theionarchaea archaeon]